MSRLATVLALLLVPALAGALSPTPGVIWSPPSPQPSAWGVPSGPYVAPDPGIVGSVVDAQTLGMWRLNESDPQGFTVNEVAGLTWTVNSHDVTPVTGQVGGARQQADGLSGSGFIRQFDYLAPGYETAAVDTLFGGNFTLEFIYHRNAGVISSYAPIWSTCTVNCAVQPLFIGLYSTGQFVVQWTSASTTYQTSATAITVTAGQTHHYALVFKGTGSTRDLDVYLDGTFEETFTGIPKPGGAHAVGYHALFADQVEGGSGFGLGWLDEMKLEGRVMTAGEIHTDAHRCGLAP